MKLFQQKLQETLETLNSPSGVPGTGAASHADANPGIHDPTTGKLVSPEQMKAAQDILNAYAAKKISAEDAAKAFFNIETNPSLNK